MMTVWPYEQTELQSRPVPIREETVPRMDENMDVFLLCGGRIVSRPERADLLAEALERTLYDLPVENSREMLAIALPECERVALVTPLSALMPDTAVVIVPRIGLPGMLRVLRHSFDGQVTIVGEGLSRTQEALREVDAHVFAYLRWVITHCRLLAMETGSVDITDRRQLSQCVLSAFGTIERLLGVELPLSHLPAFPIAFEYRGTFHTASALWMQLLLVLGLYRGFSARIWNDARLIADDELLLPTLEIPVGNRTPLPREWEECERVAQAAGMFFDVRRKRDSIRVRFCPMTPHISPVEFYSVKAMVPIIEGIREMRLE
jgi:hypothetical protein